jgi:hypothetical protein
MGFILLLGERKRKRTDAGSSGGCRASRHGVDRAVITMRRQGATPWWDLWVKRTALLGPMGPVAAAVYGAAWPWAGWPSGVAQLPSGE